MGSRRRGDGTVYVEGESDYTVTVDSYSDQADLSGASSTSQGSEKTIRQLTGILMDNAIKYSSDKGSIILTLKKKGKKVLLSVYNDAEDLPQGKLDVLFERFYRLDSSRNSGTGGSGIGLSVAKAIVQAHKGKISAENKNGNGLTIAIIL